MGDLEEVRDQRVFDELGDIARNMLASNNDSNEEFKGFQNTWVENDVMVRLHGLWKEVTSFHGPHTRAVALKALVPEQLDFCPRTPKQSVFVSVFGLT